MLRIVCSTLLLLGLVSMSSADEKTDASTLTAMKAVSRQALAMWNGDATIDTSIFMPDYRNHQEPLAAGGVSSIGLDAWVKVVESNHEAFPDLKVTFLTQLAEGDQVATHWRFTAHQDGAYENQAATGDPASWTGVSIDRFVDGKIAESWVIWDKYTQFSELGMLGRASD